MPRSNRQRRGGRRRATPSRGAPTGVPGTRGGAGTISYAGQEWSVRLVRGSDSGRRYVCPGCQQGLLATTPHTVVWPEDAMRGVDNRRHWHTPCWSARERRPPGGSFA